MQNTECIIQNTEYRTQIKEFKIQDKEHRIIILNAEDRKQNAEYIGYRLQNAG